MKTNKTLLISFVSIVICLCAFFLWNRSTTPKKLPIQDLAELKQQDPTKQEEHIVQLAAVGDVLLHERVYNDARTDVNHFDFRPMFAPIKPYIQKADFAFVNQESVIGGVDIGLSTYPSFNSPVEIADALKDTGFQIVNLANNHALDRGEKALTHAIHYWDQLGIIRTGAYLSSADRNTIRTFTKNGITFSALSYTYGTNGIRVPKPYLVNLIDKEQIRQDVEKAKQISDAVIVNLHFGKEYETLPNDDQQQLAQFLSDLGVSVIFGHHPHVLQPPAFLKGKNGNQTFVAYSLGNFLAGQMDEKTWFGGIVELTVKKNNENKIELYDPSFLPTFTYSKQEAHYKVLPLDQVTNEQYQDVSKQYDAVVHHMKTFIPNLQIIQSQR
ncbi:CapA family protein [Microbacteriaceae bacterium 4G12]